MAAISALVLIGAVGGAVAFYSSHDSHAPPMEPTVAASDDSIDGVALTATTPKPNVAANEEPPIQEPPTEKPLPIAPTTPTDVTPTIAAPIEETDAARYYVVGTSKKYHRAGCRHVTPTAREIDLREAQANFQPCKVCKPEQ